jgi:hypothetical protein
MSLSLPDGASQAASSSGGSSTKDSVGISLVETKSGARYTTL